MPGQQRSLKCQTSCIATEEEEEKEEEKEEEVLDTSTAVAHVRDTMDEGGPGGFDTKRGC